MAKGSFLHRITHAWHRYFCVMPVKVVPEADAVRKATEANLLASSANAKAGLKLLAELDVLSGMMRHEDRQK